MISDILVEEYLYFSDCFLIFMKMFHALWTVWYYYLPYGRKFLLLSSQGMLQKRNLICYIHILQQNYLSSNVLFCILCCFSLHLSLIVVTVSEPYNACLKFLSAFHNRETLLFPLEERLKKWFTEVRLRHLF